MDVLQFFAALASSFAWPVTTLVLVVILRRPLSNAFESLTHLKYKDLELSFGRELEKISEQAKDIEFAVPAPKKRLVDGDELQELLNGAERLAYEYPEPAIAMGWQAVEHELASAIVRRSIESAYPHRNTTGRNVQLLVDDNAIDTRTSDLLNSMRNLRNRAVHGRFSSERITTDEAVEFISLSRAMVVRLQMLPDKA